MFISLIDPQTTSVFKVNKTPGKEILLKLMLIHKSESKLTFN